MRMFVMCLIVFAASRSFAQTVTSFVPNRIDSNSVYMFYLHGGIVQEQGINAISKKFGLYEYSKIIDSLNSQGYNIISEVRPRGTSETKYAVKVSMQIDSLLTKGLSPAKIVVVGASQGAFIAIETAYILKNSKINYVIMAVCNDYNIAYYKKVSGQLCCNFLTIYESSDNKGTCKELFNKAYCQNSFREIRLAMGNGHGFIYEPYKEWVFAIAEWIKSGE